MSRKRTYSDSFSGEADNGIRSLLYESDDDNIRKLQKVLLNVINNELTKRQKEIIMLYYFKNVDIVCIGKLLDISPQAVSASMKRSRLKIYRYMQYFMQK